MLAVVLLWGCAPEPPTTEAPAPAAPEEDPRVAALRIEAVVPYVIEGGSYDGKAAWAWNLRHAGPDPLVLHGIPGTFDPEPVAVLALGARRRDCTPAFAGRTTPYEPLFTQGTEVLAPEAPGGDRNMAPILLAITDATTLGYTLGEQRIAGPMGDRIPLRLGAVPTAPADANLVLRFWVEEGRTTHELQVLLDGAPRPVAPDATLRVRVAPGHHTVHALDGAAGGVQTVAVDAGTCVARAVKMTRHEADEAARAFRR